MSVNADFLNSYLNLPLGSFHAFYEGRRYSVTRTESEDGKRGWLYAEELGGQNHISCNLYRLSNDTRLKPCEMPAEKVIHFVIGLTLDS